MSTPRIGRVVSSVLLCLLAAIGGAQAESPATTIDVSRLGATNRVDLTWAADGGVFYDIESTTNLAAGTWVNLTADAPVTVTNLVGTLSVLSSNSTAFFRVRPVDTQGPTITARYPAPYAVGVGRSNPLSIVLADLSGIDTNSLRLTVNGGAALLNGAVGVTVTETTFRYDPAAAGTAWGAFASTVTVVFACTDLKGNTTAAGRVGRRLRGLA